MTTEDVLRVAVVQMRYDDREPVQSRLERAVRLIEHAASADLVVLPELWAHGGFAYRTWRETAEPLDGELLTALGKEASRHGIWLHAGSVIEREAQGPRPRLWNTTTVFDPAGEPDARYRKIHRFGFSEGEATLLTAGTSLSWCDLDTASGLRCRMGLSTCYDLRFPELYRDLLGYDVEVNAVSAAWPEARIEHWLALGRARAIENQTAVIQCNLVGVDSGVVLGGHSRVLDGNGDVVAEAGGTDERVLFADVDLGGLRRLRAAFPVLADRHR